MRGKAAGKRASERERVYLQRAAGSNEGGIALHRSPQLCPGSVSPPATCVLFTIPETYRIGSKEALSRAKPPGTSHEGLGRHVWVWHRPSCPISHQSIHFTSLHLICKRVQNRIAAPWNKGGSLSAPFSHQTVTCWS